MIYITSVIILMLILVIIIFNFKIKRIYKVVEEVIRGNFNQRIRIQNHNKRIEKLSENINTLIESFQRILKENEDYENERKKMISNISHDLRTPLTSLLGYIELLNTDKNLSHKEKKEYTKIAYEKGNDLLNLMEDFFQISKLESNDIEVSIKKLNISEILRQRIVLFYNDFNKKEIKPIINIKEEDLYALGDEKAINRILNNLISNSLKYGTYGKVIGLNIKEEENYIVIEVWDKGKGIPKSDIDLIFNRLYTLEKSRNRKLQGTGLGLTISKKLAESQKGSLTVYSVPYKKTIFSLRLKKS
ncbi:HAMP domain-containing sensor histidine kinase [Clostridium oceanicum]|uniref:histidine kinase n=1 Tax=Clostridium oceanicum TaxID=1543 RepID=A0ABN1JNX8_9CLOT